MAESLQNLKRRINGVKNVNQITRAMELVAATKMRRSQEIALASRPYTFAALEMLANLSGSLTPTSASDASVGAGGASELPPIFEKRTIKKTAYVLITSDKGLAGAFNANVIRAFDRFVGSEQWAVNSGQEKTLVAIGQKAANHLEKLQTAHCKLHTRFTRVGDYTSVEEVRPIAELLIEGFLNQEWDRVVVFSMHFRSALLQEVVQQELFPIDVEALRKTAEEVIPKTGRYAELRAQGHYSLVTSHSQRSTEYIIEPSPEEILSGLARHLVEMQIYHLILEANASEHAARRAAMKSASDNAKDLADGLNLQYNKSRQAAITREIIEIVAGAEALA